MEASDPMMKLGGHSWRSVLMGISIGAMCFLAVFGFFYVSKVILETEVPYVVAEGISMYPNINNGDIVVFKGVKPEEVKVGDVIIFGVPEELKEELPPRVTHRVVEVKYVQDGLVFRTKGDNAPLDAWEVSEDKLMGKMIMRIPFAGIFILMAKTPIGILILVAGFIALSYVGRGSNERPID